MVIGNVYTGATKTAIVGVPLGQSNGYGAAANSTLDPSFKQTFANIQSWTGAAFSSLDYLVNNNQYPTLTGCGGVEFAVMTGLQTKYGGTVFHVKYAVPDTYLGNSARPTQNWLPTTPPHPVNVGY